MTPRPAYQAGRFYPASADACRKKMQSLGRPPGPEGFGARAVAAVVPHAGWDYSGRTASLVYDAIRASRPGGGPETFVFFATCHVPWVRLPSVDPEGTWHSPMGDVAIDEALARAFIEEAGDGVASDPRAHDRDHAIEVQLPFVLARWPGARVVPVAVPWTAGGGPLGEALARAVKRTARDIVACASSDLTHYGLDFYGWAPKGEGAGAYEWARTNDRALLDRVLALDPQGVVDAAQRDKSACGPGAIAAVTGYARAVGATRGALIHYTTSHEARLEGEDLGEVTAPANWVGYGGVVLG